MAQALDASAYIFEGVWTDWTKGAVRGLTLTLRPANATLLTNTLAIFVTMAGGQLWTITRFAVHQVVLRNTTTDLGTAQFMINLAWATRRKGTGSQSFAIGIATLAVLHALLFMVAGTFSNIIANAGPTVLSRSPHCGIWDQSYYDTVSRTQNTTSKETLSLSMQFYAKIVRDTQLALNYAQTCYSQSQQQSISPSCQTLQVSTLNYTAHNTSCPFDQDICHGEGVTFETAVIDSHRHLGINAQPRDRLTYQRRTSCSVLNATDRVVSRLDPPDNTDAIMPPQNISYAYYGPSQIEFTDWTYSYTNLAPFYTNYTPEQIIPYQIQAQVAWAGMSDTYNDFAPIPQLRQASSDVAILMMSYVGNYLEEVDDPWFSAHFEHHENTQAVIGHTQYAPDRQISSLACHEQHKWCNGKVCTPFLGQQQALLDAAFMSSLTPRQNVTFNRMFRALDTSNIGRVVLNLSVGNMPILATLQTITEKHTVGLGLPDNQWQLELDFWHSVSMSMFQQNFVEFNTGQIAPETKYFVAPESEAAAWWCKNLMIPSTVYQSFSVLTLLLTFVFGLLVMLCSLMVEEIAGWLQGRTNQGCKARRDQWDNDDMLVLQDRAKRDNVWKALPPPPPKDHESASRRRGAQDMPETGAAPPPYRTKSDCSKQDLRDVERLEGNAVQTWI